MLTRGVLILVQKITKKVVKSAIFEAGNPLEMGLDLRKFRKNQPFLEGEKSLETGKGFRPRAAHPVKNNSSTPPPGFRLQSFGEKGTSLSF